ncbi:MAG: hypothetical protein LBL66_11265 [Clostridiales bacterium]|jgi:hypothetical protein|nr:hypothetical protein [Clostridiales bacterium]
MNKIKRKHLGFWTAAFALAACAAFAFPARQAMPARSAEDETAAADYTQGFSDPAEVGRDFSAWYQAASGRRSVSESVGQSDGHWAIDGGVLSAKTRRQSGDAIGGTDKFAILTLIKDTYLNFDLTVDYTQGADSGYWACVAFRQAEEGKCFFDDGGAVFVQSEGIPTLWGGKLVAGPYEGGKVPNYNSAVKHTLRLVVSGNNLALYVDGVLGLEKRLNDSFYMEGYISLMSVNNDCRFDNLSVTRLPEPEFAPPPVHMPVAAADSEDALDRIGEDKTGQTPSERPLDEETPTETPPRRAGCGRAPSALSAAAPIFLAGLFFRKRAGAGR